MPTYRISHAARLLGVSDDTVRRWTESGRLPVVQDEAGRRAVDGEALAAFVLELADEPDEDGRRHSARNRLTGIVTRVTRDQVMAQVELVAGPFRIVALVSREAVDELEIVPGVVAVASIKATNVTLDLPDE